MSRYVLDPQAIFGSCAESAQPRSGLITGRQLNCSRFRTTAIAHGREREAPSTIAGKLLVMCEPGTNRPLKILIVDDDRGLVRSLRRGLERNGHQVFCAHSSAEALALAVKYKPDAAVVDLVLGEEEGPDAEPAGYRVCRHLNSLPHGPIVVIFSGMPAEDVYAESIRAGAVAHLAKPVRARHLEACLQTHCALRFENSSRPPPPFPLQVNDEECTVTLRGKLVDAKRRERAVLGLLLDHCDRVVTLSQVRAHLGSASDNAARKSVDRARASLGTDEKLVETLKNQGFILRYRSKK